MKTRLLGGIAIAAFVVVGCGDDSEGDVEAFCRLSAESDQSESIPSDEELEEIRDAAPGEIRDDVDVAIDAFQDIEDPEDIEEVTAVFDDEEVVEAFDAIEEFEAENC